ncbi:unnamed protein product [Musa acuminata subsp. malaccensis]|uniref:(wild Malaysian banana) hypothetical protein n=1 Tax=Musa acuminata subsp. malaccensis TaxID=214687 RepID=A0A804I2P7_MUSAM|nr:PREDICTED: protein TIME FOR COFFEE isoform X1 [Musa acuminata subsp. malaccensis]CAG1862027.1 unnamed protein product [Musa acuminata subsp. malaccensis]
MERNREARRGTMAASTEATNDGGGGNVLSRRRHRNSSSVRDSPDEDGRVEMQETWRPRDWGAKKTWDRDRSSRSKKRRGERLSNRDEEDESSEESLDEDEEAEDDDLLLVPARLPPPSPPPSNPGAAASSSPKQNHHHCHQLLRKSFPPKAVKWRTDETIGVTVPRKARSASARRSHEAPALGGGGGGGRGRELMTRQASTTRIPSCSSNGSLPKKMKLINGEKPSDISKSASLVEDEIEIEVAEVLFGMTRQFECLSKHDSDNKLDSRDIDADSGNEAKSRASSPSLMSPSPASYPSDCPSALTSSNSCSNPASLPTVASKRKMQMHVESFANPVGLHNLSSFILPSGDKMDARNQIKAETSSPGSERHNASPATKNGSGLIDVFVSRSEISDVQQQKWAKTVQELRPLTGGSDDKEEIISPAKGSACTDLDTNICELIAQKIVPDIPKEQKFNIDLMAPPPGELSPERDDLNVFDSDRKPKGPDVEMALKEVENPTDGVLVGDKQQIEKPIQTNIDLRKQLVVKQNRDLCLDLEKPKSDDIGTGRVQVHKKQVKEPKVEPKQEKSASASSLHMPFNQTWPGSFPPYGYMGQGPTLQAVVPMDGTAGPSISLQPPPFQQMHPRPKRCATQCYITQMISNHQKFMRMSSFWTAASGAAPLYGANPYNLNVVPPSDVPLSGKTKEGSSLGKNMSTLQDTKGTPAYAMPYSGHTSQEKMPSANNTNMESAQGKQLILQQMTQSGSTNKMPHVPAFIFPINQQQATPTASAAAANRVGVAKSTTVSGAEVRVSGALGSAGGSSGGGGSATPVNLSFSSLPPNEAQYLAFVQNNAYPFPIPPQIAAAPPFPGTSNAQAMPFFYPSHMLHASQQRSQQQQLAGPPRQHGKQSHPNLSTLSGSSSQKYPQKSQCMGGNGAGAASDGGAISYVFSETHQQQDLLSQQACHSECSKDMKNDLPAADGTNFQSQKAICFQKGSTPIHPQNFVLMSTAAAAIAMGNSKGHGDKQPVYQQPQEKQNMTAELALPQAFTIPFASFGGAGTVPSDYDFSSMTQNHSILWSLPEPSRDGYHQMAKAAVTTTTQAAEQKKVHQVTEGKSAAWESDTSITVEEGRNIIAASKGLQHLFSFAKSDNEPPIQSGVSNSVLDLSSRSVNLIQAPGNCGISVDHAAGTSTAATSVLTSTNNVANSQQQKQQLIHSQKHQLQQLQMQHHLASSHAKSSGSRNNTNIHPESLTEGFTARFPQSLSGPPQALVHGGSPIQWPQGKTSRVGDITAVSSTPLPKKNLREGHQIQISFGLNSNEVVALGGQHLSGTCDSPSVSSVTIAVGSSSKSVSKIAGGSPRECASMKPGPSTSAIALTQQSAVKQSVTSSSSKPISMSSFNMPSILGRPQKVPAPSSNTKQQQQPQQLPDHQTFSQAQLFFSNPHMQQVPYSKSSAAAPTVVQYYEKPRSEQHTRQSQLQQQLSSAPSSTGMPCFFAPTAFTLAGVPTSDPAKAMAAASVVAANSIKGSPPSNFLNATQLALTTQSASGSHPPISATFPYMSSLPFSMKPSAEQKPVAGNGGIQAFWQSDKR